MILNAPQFWMKIVFLMISFDVFAADKSECKLPDGSYFSFEGRRYSKLEIRSLGSHDIRSYGRALDKFAQAYSIVYHGINKVETPLAFNDDDARCSGYGISDDVVYALTDRPVFRRQEQENRGNRSVLVVSLDGGRTFSENIYPGAQQEDLNSVKIQVRLQQFGYYRSRFAIKNKKYLLEISDPLTFNEFLLFTSDDAGRTWQEPVLNTEPYVFPKEEVEQWRNQFASDKYVHKRYEATRKVCQQYPGLGCAKKTDDYWYNMWRQCREKYTGRECLERLPEPTPIEP